MITVGALLGMAAHLEGRGCTVLDFTGLAQKNGAVMSHVRLAPQPEDLYAVRIAAGGADLVLGCDMVVAATPAALSRIEPGVTRAVINGYMTPIAAFVMNGDMDFETAAMLQSIRDAAGDDAATLVDGTGLATALLGDLIATNLFMLGYAWQKGLVPLSLAAIERAIELNGVAVETSKRTFAWGRLAAHDPAAVEAQARRAIRNEALPEPQRLAAMVAHRVGFLNNYQNAGLRASAIAPRCGRVASPKQELARGRTGLTEAAARNLFTLMAYKGRVRGRAALYRRHFFAKAEPPVRRRFPRGRSSGAAALGARDPATGEPKKRAFGPWMRHVFKLLTWLRPLRGTALDIFGYTRERRMERRLIADYEAVIRELSASLSPDNHALAVEIASLPAKMRGFGHIKARNVESAKACEAELLALLRNKDSQVSAA